MRSPVTMAAGALLCGLVLLVASDYRASLPQPTITATGGPIIIVVKRGQTLWSIAREPRPRAEKLISEVGLNPVSLGGPEQVELVDSVLKLWFTLARGRKMGRSIVFKVLTR